MIKYKLIDLKNGCFFVRFDDDFDMAMTFLRYQEFQDSPKFAGKNFTITEFMRWYTNKYDPESRKFTYSGDWAGYNIPVSLIGKVECPDKNEYDDTMYDISKKTCDKKYRGYLDFPCNLFLPAYLISASKTTTKIEYKITVLHELTHAMYYLDEEYKQKVKETYKNINKKLLNKLTKIVEDKGYADVQELLEDELQAYLTTSNNEYDEWFKSVLKNKEFIQLKKELKAIHKDSFKKFITEKNLKAILKNE